jgi:hypothetical protein
VTLSPLPIALRSIFLAKVAALALFVVAFTAVVNFSSTVTFPIISLRGKFWGLVYGILIHGLTVLAASVFIFGFLVAIEGVLLNVLSFRLFRKVSVLVQSAMVFALLSVFFLFPNVAISIPQLKAIDSSTLYAYPPAWFLAMNEVLLGSRDPVFLKLAAVAWKALAAVLLILGETIRDATEEIGKRLHRPSGPDAGKNWLDQRYLFDQVAEALKTIMMILQPPEDTVPALPALYDGREITGKSIAAGIMHRVIAEWSQRYPWLTIRSRLSAEVIERISTRFNDEKIVGPTTTYATRLEDINRISNRRAGASHEGASR